MEGISQSGLRSAQAGAHPAADIRRAKHLRSGADAAPGLRVLRDWPRAAGRSARARCTASSDHGDLSVIFPVILSGGSGTRLWPLSRELHPKQFLALIGAHTMLQETILRLSGLAIGAPIVVCNEAHRFLVAEQLRVVECRPQAIVLEPVGRNTAPAIALAALAAKATNGDDALLLVLPADHVIRDVKAFHAAIQIAAEAAQRGSLVTFGIVPDVPETGYGYIRRGERDGNSYRIAEFVEKPDLGRAQKFVASGDYY